MLNQTCYLGVIAGAFRRLEYPTPPFAVYPEEAINGHRAFIARRRALRPSEEYRWPTDGEWDEFLGHFERRRLVLGDCGRAYGTGCIDEHAPLTEPLNTRGQARNSATATGTWPAAPVASWSPPPPATTRSVTASSAGVVWKITTADGYGWPNCPAPLMRAAPTTRTARA